MAPVARLSFGALQRRAYGIAGFSARSPGRNGLAADRIDPAGTVSTRVVIFGEQHLSSYQEYYNESRTHLSLKKDAPVPGETQRVGRVLALPILGRLRVRVCISDRDSLMFSNGVAGYSSHLRLWHVCHVARVEMPR